MIDGKLNLPGQENLEWWNDGMIQQIDKRRHVSPTSWFLPVKPVDSEGRKRDLFIKMNRDLCYPLLQGLGKQKKGVMEQKCDMEPSHIPSQAELIKIFKMMFLLPLGGIC